LPVTLLVFALSIRDDCHPSLMGGTEVMTVPL